MFIQTMFYGGEAGPSTSFPPSNPEQGKYLKLVKDFVWFISVKWKADTDGTDFYVAPHRGILVLSV